MEGLGDEPQVVVNLSNRALTETEYKAINHGVQFGFSPIKSAVLSPLAAGRTVYFRFTIFLQFFISTENALS